MNLAMKDIIIIISFLFAIYCSFGDAAAGRVTYKAAVAETGANYDMRNISRFVKLAASEGAQIIVFPENGPHVYTTYTEQDPNFSWDCRSDCVSTEVVNLPTADDGLDISDSSGSCNFDDAVTPLSCYAYLAKIYNIYLSINLVDFKECITDSSNLPSFSKYNVTNHCVNFRGNLVYLFNTLVTFGPNGALVAKYYKRLIFGTGGNDLSGNWPKITQTTKELSEHFNAEGIFTTNFGVTFASAICFDINDRENMVKLKENGISDIVYANTYENVLFSETIGTTVAGNSYFYETNIIAASTGLSGASGSGIYSNGDLITDRSTNTLINCADLLAERNIYPSTDECNRYLVAEVTSPPKGGKVAKKSKKGYKGGNNKTVRKKVSKKHGKHNSKSWVSKQEGYTVVTSVPDLVGLWNDLSDQPPPIGQQFPFEVGSLQYETFSQVNMVGSVSLLSPPSVPGIYTATTSFKSKTCTVTAEFEEGSRSSNNITYALIAFPGMTYFPNTPCPYDVSSCIIARCLAFSKNGVCIPVQGIEDINATVPKPLKSETPSWVELRSAINNLTTYPMVYVADNNLQPAKISDLELYGNFRYSEKEKLHNDNGISVKSYDEFSFLTLATEPGNLQIPEQCNVCSSAYDLYNFEDTRVPANSELYSKWCSYYNTSLTSPYERTMGE